MINEYMGFFGLGISIAVLMGLLGYPIKIFINLFSKI